MAGSTGEDFDGKLTTADAGPSPEAPSVAGDAKLDDRGTLSGQPTVAGTVSGTAPADHEMETVDPSARYELEEVIGRGGMGEVLLARDRRLGRQVAIKRIRTELVGEGAVQRFFAEARALAALNHPNIVQLYDCGRDQDGPFLILEYVGGETLRERCRSGPIDTAEAIGLVDLLCDGLERAHALGIIHRDIKPANILMTPAGVPKLTDFGIAKTTSADRGLSLSGQVLGTPDFMPPEQRAGSRDVDERADQWSLAATLYQMLTGETPGVIDLEAVPQSVRPVLARALKSRKEDRFGSLREFRVELTRCARSQPAAGGPSSLNEGPRIGADLTAGSQARPAAFDFRAASQLLQGIEEKALAEKEQELLELVTAMKSRNPPEGPRVRAVVKAAEAYLKINPGHQGIQQVLEAVRRNWPEAVACRLTQDALMRLLGNFRNTRVYVAPHIPIAKLKNAVQSYIQGIDPSNVLLLHDVTALGGAREGVALTTDAVHWKVYGQSPGHCDYRDITSLVIKKSLGIASSLGINEKTVPATHFVIEPLFRILAAVSGVPA